MTTKTVSQVSDFTYIQTHSGWVYTAYIIARCTVARLMKKLGIQGVWRGKNKQTTRSRDDQKRAPDLVKRNFRADQPNHLWVADFSVPQQAA